MPRDLDPVVIQGRKYGTPSFLLIIVDSQSYLGVKTCGESHISSKKKAPSKGLKDGV
jgi:hypothetical protein